MEVHTCPVYQLKKSGITSLINININTVREAQKFVVMKQCEHACTSVPFSHISAIYTYIHIYI